MINDQASFSKHWHPPTTLQHHIPGTQYQ